MPNADQHMLCTCFTPRHVVIVVGEEKVCHYLLQAFLRIGLMRARVKAFGTQRTSTVSTQLESFMNETFDIWMDMQEQGWERVRFRRGAHGESVVKVAPPDGEWAPIDTANANAPAWLREVGDRFRRGGHERLDIVLIVNPGVRFVCAVHDTSDGPGAGGLRRHDLVHPQIDVIQDALDLSRAMTYKNRAAGVGRGGSKLCLQAPELPSMGRKAWIDAIAQEIELSGTLTGPDIGLSQEDLEDLQKKTDCVTGIRNGGTTESAALGVHTALMATAAALGTPLNELHLVVMGVGGLGQSVAQKLAADGARLTVTDKDFERLDAFMEGLTPDQRSRAGIVAPYQVLSVAADVVVPCAVGGLFTMQNAQNLLCRAVCGGANNQLGGHSLEEDLEIAHALHDTGVLFVPDWLASAGGTIHGTLEHQEGAEFNLKAVRARIQRVCGEMVDRTLAEARRTGHPPLEIALRRMIIGAA